MKIFIDGGAYRGKSVDKAFRIIDNIDLVYTFEPHPYYYKKIKEKFKDNDNIKCINKALDIENGNGKLYIHQKGWKAEGHTLMKSKIDLKDDYKEIETIDIIDFTDEIKDNQIILKLDIEGKEYDILEKLIETNYIDYIDTIYCEWHYHKVESISKKRHNKLIKELQDYGFDLNGDNKHDEFKYVKG